MADEPEPTTIKSLITLASDAISTTRQAIENLENPEWIEARIDSLSVRLKKREDTLAILKAAEAAGVTTGYLPDPRDGAVQLTLDESIARMHLKPLVVHDVLNGPPDPNLCPCGKKPVCRGNYEGDEAIRPACDDCCGHSQVDGSCAPIDWTNEAAESQPETQHSEAPTEEPEVETEPSDGPYLPPLSVNPAPPIEEAIPDEPDPDEPQPATADHTVASNGKRTRAKVTR